jgi:hypothetical protein
VVAPFLQIINRAYPNPSSGSPSVCFRVRDERPVRSCGDGRLRVGKARMGPLSEPAQLQPQSEVLRSLVLGCLLAPRERLVRKGAS